MLSHICSISHSPSRRVPSAATFLFNFTLTQSTSGMCCHTSVPIPTHIVHEFHVLSHCCQTSVPFDIHTVHELHVQSGQTAPLLFPLTESRNLVPTQSMQSTLSHNSVQSHIPAVHPGIWYLHNPCNPHSLTTLFNPTFQLCIQEFGTYTIHAIHTLSQLCSIPHSSCASRNLVPTQSMQSTLSHNSVQSHIPAVHPGIWYLHNPCNPHSLTTLFNPTFQLCIQEFGTYTIHAIHTLSQLCSIPHSSCASRNLVPTQSMQSTLSHNSVQSHIPAVHPGIWYLHNPCNPHSLTTLFNPTFQLCMRSTVTSALSAIFTCTVRDVARNDLQEGLSSDTW